MDTTAPLDTTVEVVTPENIAFEYQLAGPFLRLPAYLIDIAIRWTLFALTAILLIIASAVLRIELAFFATLAVLFVLYFLQAWFYGVLFEAYFNGRTPGKWMMGLRVLSVEGHPITPIQALLRNLLRAADFAPIATIPLLDADLPALQLLPTGFVALAATVSTRRLQRLGDLAAGTMVVLDQRNWTLPVVRVDDPRVAALATFIPADYRVPATMARTLAIYAERRIYLAPPRRREIARHLAAPLIDRFAFRRDIDPDLLLCALYHRTFIADERAEPADLGPLAGFSPLIKDLRREESADEGAKADRASPLPDGDLPASAATLASASPPAEELR